MTEVSKEAVDALAKAVRPLTTVNGEVTEMSRVASLTVADRLSKLGYTIAPIAQPVADEKLREAIKSVEETSRRATDCGYSWPIIKDALDELAELRAEGQWRPIDTLPDSLDRADLFATYIGKPYRRYIDCKRDKQFNRWYFECPEMGWQPVGGGGIHITHYCVPKLPTTPATGEEQK